MVAFASLIGAAAIYAGVASAGPTMMDSGSYSGYGSPPPANQYGSGMNDNKGMDDNKGNMYTTSSAMAMSTSTPSYDASYPASSSSSSSYGSGSSNWNNNGGYDSCVQQCVAQYGSPSSMYMPPSSTSTPPPGSDSSPPGSGATHTVIVAPTQGVLRYVPFVVNASVGDTVLFMWGANNHTVTKSSQLELCNKTSDAPFASGEQNKPFSFTQVVNDTNPTFYYCGTPGHCEKGMFGIINPPNAFQQPSSASNMMSSLGNQYPSTQAAMSYNSNVTANSTYASNWGMNIDMSKMPDWSQSYMAENIMYTQNFIAMNPEVVPKDGGVLDLSTLGSNPIMLPTDVAAAARANNAQSSPSPSTTSSSTSATPSAAAASGGASGGLKSGAGALASPRVAVALVAVAAAFFAL